MTLTVLTGGARCGKSVAALAVAEAIGVPVVFVATAEAGDDDMARRIERHRAERSPGWTTVEAPRDLGEAVDSANPDTTIIIDCLGLWVTNRMLAEVGSGVVPATPMGREFRDLLGSVNQAVVRAADAAYLVVAGRLLPLVDPAAELRV